MGAWEELDTEISVEIDTSDLDSCLDSLSEYSEDWVEDYLLKVKDAIEKGSKEAIKDLANDNRSWQEQALQKCKHPSGRLATSINDDKQDDYTFIVGTSINEIYPLSIEFGRGPVNPIPPNTRLKYYGEDGYIIYPLSAGPADPVPFVAPAYEKTDAVAEEYFIHYIGDRLP